MAMQIIVVGNRDGKRVVRWSGVLWLVLTCVLCGGVFPGLLYRLIAGAWSLPAFVLPGAIAVGAVFGSFLAKGMKTPISQLPPVK